MRVFLALVLVAVAFPASAAAQPSTGAERAAAVVQPATVLVTVTWQGWVRDKLTGEFFGGNKGYHVTTSCSGVVVNPAGYVATASHCVHIGAQSGGLGGEALIQAAVTDLAQFGRVGDPVKAKKELTERAIVEGSRASERVGRVVTVERTMPDGKRDTAVAQVVDQPSGDGGIAVLKVERTGLPSVEIRQDAAVAGMPAFAAGFPDVKLPAAVRNGQISGRLTQGNRPFYEFGGADGLPGGPLVDEQGRLIGVVTQPNLANDVATLKELVPGKQVNAELGAHDRNYRTGLDRYFAGDFDSAVEHFDAVLAGSPAHIQAAEFRAKAAVSGGNPGVGTGLLLILAGVSGGIAIVASVLWIRARRRVTSPPGESESEHG